MNIKVRTFVSICILGAVSVLGATPANAKVFYVAQNSNRTTGGTTGCAGALSVAWFNNPSSWGTASHQISAGTTVYLCGTFRGTPGERLLNVQGNGAPGAPITIKFTGGAILTAPYWSGLGAIYLQHRSYIVVDGGTNGIIENTQNGTGRPYHQSSVAVYAQWCNNCTVQNLTIQNLYVRTSATDLAPNHSINCVYWRGANQMTVNHITCHDASWAVVGDGNNFVLENSNIYHVDHGLASGPGNLVSGYSVHNNHFHDFANWDSPTNTYHHDGIHFWGQNGGTLRNGAIYSNTFDGDFGVNITGHIFLQDSVQHVAVYNNICQTPMTRVINSVWFHAISTSMPGGPATGNSAYNNSINAGGHRSGTAILADNQLQFTAVNNIASGGIVDMSLQHGTTLTSTGVNHNIYHDLFAAIGDRNQFAGFGKWYYQLSQWQSACRCDSGSKLVSSAASVFAINTSEVASTDVTADAVNLGVTTTDAASDPTLQYLSSVGVGDGLNLSDIASDELAGLAFDKNGTPRPVSGPWNVGPF